MVKVSVIIPLYNAVRHIENCIKSITSQSYKGFEVIFVDDCSTDDSLALLKEKCSTLRDDIRFRFLQTTQNSGPGTARNIGLKSAEGEYVIFVDIDDTMDKEMLTILTEEAIANDLEITECQALKVDSYDGSNEHDLLSNPSIPNSKISDKRRRKLLTSYVAYIWTMLFQKEFLLKNNIEFPPQRNSEDSAFIGCCLLMVERMGQVRKPLYYYQTQNDSLSNNINSSKYNEKRASFNYMLEFAKKKGLFENFREELEFCYLKKGYLRPLLDYLKECNHPQSEEVLNMEDELYELFPNIEKNHYLEKSMNIRFAFNIIHMAPGVITSGSQILKDLKRLLGGNK